MSIAIENCSFQYPGTSIGVHDVSISAAQGELIAVIGASGSGKTTMLKLVAGFEQPTQGRVLISGQDMTSVPARLRNVGVVFQTYALFPLMNCVDNVAYSLKIRGIATAERRRRAQEMLERVGLSAFGGRVPGSMSGGQQQRVALARALVFNPTVLLLDEPLSALDAALRIELRSQIRELQHEHGITALHVTHDQEEALSMADKVALMHKGRIIQCASPHELYDHPQNRLVAAFVGHANLWDATVITAGRVRVPFGELNCNTGSTPPGTSVCVLVRPEHVAIDSEGTDSVNSFTGALHSDTFLGALRRYELVPEGNSGIRIKGETSGREVISRITIRPEHVYLLPLDEE